MYRILYTLLFHVTLWSTFLIIFVTIPFLKNSKTFPFCRWILRNGIGRIMPCEFYGKIDTKSVLVMNHSCGIDFLLPMLFPIPIAVFYDKSILKYFFIRYVLKHIPGIPVDRKLSSEYTIQSGVDFVQSSDVSLMVFPEGMRNATPEKLMTFRRGAFEIAKRANHTIQPIVCVNSGKFSRFEEDKNIILDPMYLPLRFYVLDPMEVMGDALEMGEKVRDVMQKYVDNEYSM